MRLLSPCFYSSSASWSSAQVQMREKNGRGRKCYRREVWTFSSVCSPVWRAANVKRPSCEFPTEMGSVPREREPVSSLLFYLRTAAASICQLFMVATWGKHAPPLHFRREAEFFWQRGISGFNDISRTLFLLVGKYVCMSFLVKHTHGCWNTHLHTRAHTRAHTHTHTSF